MFTRAEEFEVKKRANNNLIDLIYHRIFFSRWNQEDEDTRLEAESDLRIWKSYSDFLYNSLYARLPTYPENSWILYLLSKRRDSEASNYLKKSMELGNPFAYIDYARRFEKDREKKSELFLQAFKLGAIEGMLRNINLYLSDQKLDKDLLVIKVLEDLDKIKNAKIKRHRILIAKYYLKISEMTKDNSFMRDYIYYTNKAGVFLNENDRKDNSKKLYTFIKEYDKLENGYMELLEAYNNLFLAYEQLSIIKETDFNGMVASKIAKYLGHEIIN